jgi:hypothetical protein
MNIYTPLSVAVRIVIYALLLMGAAELIRLDALYPMEDGYYGEISFTEFSQEFILLLLVILYLIAGRKYLAIRPVTNLLSLLFLASFIREFNFLISWWFYLVLPILLAMIWIFIRNYSKVKQATAVFFTLPASGWFTSGLLVTFVFSRLFGRSSFWRLLYDENSYRIAKAATEEGLELAGYLIILISVFELFLSIRHLKQKEST